MPQVFRERSARLGWKLRLWPWISPVEQHVFFLSRWAGSVVSCWEKKCAALDQQKGSPFNLDQGVDSRSREAGWLVVAPKYHQLSIYKSCHRESFAVNGHWVKSVLVCFCFFRVPRGSSLGLDLCWWHNRFLLVPLFQEDCLHGKFLQFYPTMQNMLSFFGSIGSLMIGPVHPWSRNWFLLYVLYVVCPTLWHKNIWSLNTYHNNPQYTFDR